MDKKELEIMLADLHIGFGKMNKFDKVVWIKAFAIYNKDNNKNLSTSCVPCYTTVYMYHIKKTPTVLK
jgi:hypothetical protein